MKYLSLYKKCILLLSFCLLFGLCGCGETLPASTTTSRKAASAATGSAAATSATTSTEAVTEELTTEEPTIEEPTTEEPTTEEPTTEEPTTSPADAYLNSGASFAVVVRSRECRSSAAMEIAVFAGDGKGNYGFIHPGEDCYQLYALRDYVGLEDISTEEETILIIEFYENERPSGLEVTGYSQQIGGPNGALPGDLTIEVVDCKGNYRDIPDTIPYRLRFPTGVWGYDLPKSLFEF